MRACKCPNCGSNLNFDDDGREYVFCQFCGTKIDLMDERTIHTEHIYDEARVKNADSIHRIVDIFASSFEDYRRKKAEKEAREAREAEEAREAAKAAQAQSQENMEAFETAFIAGLGWCIRFAKTHRSETLAAIAGLAVLFALFTGSSHISEVKKQKQAESIAASHTAMGEILYPSGAGSSGDYRNTYKKLKDAGFTNVTAEGAGDLFFGILETENDIIEITVDGAPDFEKNTWYPSDTPIVIKYHSFSKETESTIKSGAQTVTQKAQDAVNSAVSSAQSKVSQAVDSATSAISDMNNAQSNSTIVLPTTTRASLMVHSYERAYVHTGADSSQHYWLTSAEDHVACMINTYDKTAYIMPLPSEDFTAGVSISFSSTGYFLQSGNPDKIMFITYGDDSPLAFNATSADKAWAAYGSIQSFYDLRSVHNLDTVPSSGVRSNQNPSHSSTLASSSKTTSSASSSLPAHEPSLDYTPSHKETNYDDAYCLRYSEYANYCLISYQDKIVRSFTYGNESTESYVGHITGGSKTTGLIVHYNYDSGWDETIQISGSHMILTDGNGNTFTYTLAPLHPVRDIYTDNHYRDIIEN